MTPSWISLPSSLRVFQKILKSYLLSENQICSNCAPMTFDASFFLFFSFQVQRACRCNIYISALYISPSSSSSYEIILVYLRASTQCPVYQTSSDAHCHTADTCSEKNPNVCGDETIRMLCYQLLTSLRRIVGVECGVIAILGTFILLNTTL